MSISMQNVCSDWTNDNPGYLANWEYDLETEAYRVSVEHEKRDDIVLPGSMTVSTKSSIPANADDIGSAVVLLVLDVLKAQLMLYEDYRIFI